ncbi:MAG: NFACT family protein, partial [Pyrinomonadaceae bacterium]
ITIEIENELVGRKFGRIFTFQKLQFAIDFRLHESRFLFISIEPFAPRIYLVKRILKDLDKQSHNPSAFFLFLRKRLSNADLKSVEKIKNERVLKFAFNTFTELGNAEKYFLIVQLTGRSANIFLLDENQIILDSLRENKGSGQEIAERYLPPDRPENFRLDETVFPQFDFQSLSEALDVYYLKLDAEKSFQIKAKSAEAKIKQEIKKRENLVRKLKQDLENHGDAEKWKRCGDLILANLANAKRFDDKIIVTDYFDENLPEIEIAAEVNLTLTEASEKYFKKYTKARNAKDEIFKRMEIVRKELEKLFEERAKIESAIEEKDEEFFKSDETPANKHSRKKDSKNTETKSKSRNFQSSEGYEIFVGKGAKDNDFLTFRVAKSSDLWLHAADYPGSHVVIKSRNREEIPQKTLIEAAQLAAFYSQARTESKVAVNFTLKKFVHKPKGAVAGLVNLASFKTVLVKPKHPNNEK